MTKRSLFLEILCLGVVLVLRIHTVDSRLGQHVGEVCAHAPLGNGDVFDLVRGDNTDAILGAAAVE